MVSVLLALGLFTGVFCGPLPSPLTESLPDERSAAVVSSNGSPKNIPQEIKPTVQSDSGSTNEEKLQAQETFYPVGGVWWGIRPWGGWGGYRPWHRPPWGNHWGGHWGGGQWGRTSS